MRKAVDFNNESGCGCWKAFEQILKEEDDNHSTETLNISKRYQQRKSDYNTLPFLYIYDGVDKNGYENRTFCGSFCSSLSVANYSGCAATYCADNS